MTDSQPRSWEIFTRPAKNSVNGGVWYQDFGPEVMYKSIYGPNHPAVRVRLVEDPAGDYAGWISHEEGQDENGIGMVQRREIFSIQFAYGVKAEMDAGHGSAVRLRVEELPTH